INACTRVDVTVTNQTPFTISYEVFEALEGERPFGPHERKVFSGSLRAGEAEDFGFWYAQEGDGELRIRSKVGTRHLEAAGGCYLTPHLLTASCSLRVLPDEIREE